MFELSDWREGSYDKEKMSRRNNLHNWKEERKVNGLVEIRKDQQNQKECLEIMLKLVLNRMLFLSSDMVSAVRNRTCIVS